MHTRRCPSTVQPVFPVLVFQLSKQQKRTRTTFSTVLGTPSEAYSDKEIPLRRALRRLPCELGSPSGNLPKKGTFTTWNRTGNCTWTPPGVPHSHKIDFFPSNLHAQARKFSGLFGDKFGESLVGSQAPYQLLGSPRTSLGSSPNFPGSFRRLPRKFSATSPEVLSLWNLTAIQRFPGSSPNFPGSSGTSPEVNPFLWEA